MQLVETHIKNDKEIEAICGKAKLLYNKSLYYWRQSIFGNIQYFSEYELTGLFASHNEHSYKDLPAQTAQQVIKLLFKNIKSWQKARKEYKKNPSKFLGRPKLPNYKKKTSIVIFTSQQIKLKNGFIHFPKITNLKPLKTKVNNVAQVRIVPQANTFKIEIVYEKETTNLKLEKQNALAIDLGLNNVVTGIDNVGNKPFIINGKILKSYNHWYNKKRAKLMSFIGNKGSSNKISKLTHYRNCYIEDKLHKASRYIINYCINNNIGTIAIGKNKQWKQSINIGKKNNQKFVELPHAKLIDKIIYKAALVGIKVVVNEESYTSKCDALALEPIKKHEKYLGKRKKRGLFQSSMGKLINADVNGAINIGRKSNVFCDDFVKSLSNSGCAFQPIRINFNKYLITSNIA
jgi:putative transposase